MALLWVAVRSRYRGPLNHTSGIQKEDQFRDTAPDTNKRSFITSNDGKVAPQTTHACGHIVPHQKFQLASSERVIFPDSRIQRTHCTMARCMLSLGLATLAFAQNPFIATRLRVEYLDLVRAVTEI
jgi:hypothetical protein